MVVFSKSCSCQSANKKLWIVALQNITKLAYPCGNDADFAINLETQDYETLGFCQPPVMDQYYSIGLRLPHINSTNRVKCNSSHPYFWRNRRNEKIDCADGSPLELPRNFNGDQYCNLVSVSPGSLRQTYNATWTRCNSVQHVICQLERNASITNFCKNASTPTATTTTSTTTPTATTALTTATKATTTITVLSNNSTAIIAGSVQVFVILLLVMLLHLFQKRNKTKTNASKKRNHKIAVQK